MLKLIKLADPIKRFYHIHDFDMGFPGDDEIGLAMEMVCECSETARSIEEAALKVKNSVRIFWVKMLITAFVVCGLGSYTIMELFS